MQDVINAFTTAMTWLILLMSSVVIVLLGLYAWHLQRARRRALLGITVMALVLVATAANLVLLATHRSKHGPLLSPFLRPLVSSVLMVSIYRLSFPPETPLPASRLSRMRQLLLFVLNGGALIVAGCLVLLDLLLP